jgi:hypothetical protein
MRTDENNNPAAFTVDIARQADLVPGTDYEPGTPFPAPSTLVTAKLLGDPVAITIRVIDAISYFTKSGSPRWTYAAIPAYVWSSWVFEQKRDMVGYHYRHEGGTAMKSLFPNYDFTK